MRMRILAAGLLAAAVLAGCGHATGGSPLPSSSATLPEPDGPTVDVEMQDYRFAEADLTIPVGTTVRWTNRGQAPHTATAEDGTFATEQLATGASASHTFVTPGTFDYVCALHPDMTGTITVRDDPGEPSPASSPSAAPSATASAATGPVRITVPLVIATAHTVTADIVDWTGGLVAATSGTPGDGASVAPDAVVVTQSGPTGLDITWTGGPCDRTVSVVIDPATAAITVVQEPCEGDAIAFDRIVHLEFAEPIDAATWQGILQSGVDTPA
jgi:plastocyanin